MTSWCCMSGSLARKRNGATEGCAAAVSGPRCGLDLDLRSTPPTCGSGHSLGGKGEKFFPPGHVRPINPCSYGRYQPAFLGGSTKLTGFPCSAIVATSIGGFVNVREERGGDGAGPQCM